MGRLSKYNEPSRLIIFINRFWDAVTLLEDREEVTVFLKDLLTPTEIRMISKRLQIADMLAKGYKYEDIVNYTRVTKQTISSVNNKLSFGNDGLVKILKRLEEIDQKRQDKLEGKKNIFGQPPGMGRALGNIASGEISKAIRHHKKVSSLAKRSNIDSKK